jgi:hypothetical protein
MRRRLIDRRWRAPAVVGVAIYAVFLLTAQFEHHDLLCHIKTPQHCTSCVSSPLGADPAAPTPFASCQLADAGSALALHVLAQGTLLAVRSTGRSPPVLA